MLAIRGREDILAREADDARLIAQTDRALAGERLGVGQAVALREDKRAAAAHHAHSVRDRRRVVVAHVHLVRDGLGERRRRGQHPVQRVGDRDNG